MALVRKENGNSDPRISSEEGVFPFKRVLNANILGYLLKVLAAKALVYIIILLTKMEIDIPDLYGHASPFLPRPGFSFLGTKLGATDSDQIKSQNFSLDMTCFALFHPEHPVFMAFLLQRIHSVIR